ncbi:MAG: cyanophycinase [Thermoanaerobaculum sp.]|nr:cyanophycinase [Thermoanaerobaculum sp.]MDW7966780.1 cyanophycinase [Thermoanaerobaculum sp.]
MVRTLSGVLLAFGALAGWAQERPLGHLILIGGGERPATAMHKFVELAGGPQALILLLPTASEDPDYISSLHKSFSKEYGCQQVKLLNVKTPADALRKDYVALVERAGGIFFSGGDQTRILRALKDSPLLAAIRQAYHRGAVLGGTSAGTACMSPLMITGEGNFDVIRPGAVELWPGLGFFTGVIVDQHFVARRRFNRLVTVVLEHPELLGVGIDEDTAVWVKPDGTFQVLGDGCVLVLDAHGRKPRRVPAPAGGSLFSADHLTLHVLAAGDRFDLERRQLVEPSEVEVETNP